ncbi:hypothetical protein HanPSC8_Chr17g0773081 [Helianthus annuus]|nr:hypothetical protein HanIR_Chr17g0874001 [Helianthus annuus]KAJ0813408.1 hypothetical protein HanPSC8_Chr17g0773081 [Helianthus annuus]
MGARKDLFVSFSRLTQEKVGAFCMEWSIGLKFNLVAPGCDKSVDQCPSGWIALYYRHFEFSNLRHPFSTLVLNLLEYYRVLFGQIHPKGMASVLHFEVLCRASGYDPSLLLFCRFFRLAKNGDWFTFETSEVDTCLISSMVTTLGAWKDRFFWVSDSIVPFKMAIRQCPSRVRPFPEHLLVLLGISKLWDKPDRDPVLMRSGQGIHFPCFTFLHSLELLAYFLFLMNFAVMSVLDFVKSDDTSNVVFMDAQAAEGDDAVARGSEQRFEDVGYVSVPNVKGFTKTAAPKALTRRSARRMLKSAAQSTSSDPVELSDDMEVFEGQCLDAEKEKYLLVLGKNKASSKMVVVTPVQGSSSKDVEGLSEDEVYVPNWSVKVGDSFKDASVCADVLANFALPGVRDAISEMEGDNMLSRLMLSSCNLSALVAEGVTHFRKGMQEYEEFSKKKEKMKASMAAMKKDIDGFSKKEEAWVKKVGELTHRHEIEINDLRKSFEADKLKLKVSALNIQKKAFAEEKEGLKASVVQATGDNQWLIEQGFQQVVTYLLHCNEFNSALGEVYTKLLNYGKHLGLIAGFKLHESSQALEQSPMFRPEAFGIFKESVQQMKRLTYPYVSEVSSCFGKPLSVLQELKPAGLNEKVCAEVLDSLSKKRSRSGDSEETFSEDADVSKDASLEDSAVGGDGGPKAKKAKKAKKGKMDGFGALKPSAGV